MSVIRHIYLFERYKTVTTPNDLLGLAYVKEVINHNYPIESTLY